MFNSSCMLGLLIFWKGSVLVVAGGGWGVYVLGLLIG